MSAPFAPAGELAAEARPLRVWSICTGYGGLDSVLALVLNAETVLVADNDPDVAKLLALRFPNVLNVGDIKDVKWIELLAQLDPPDIICAGFPCQDISQAGKRKGIAPSTRSGLWTWIAHIIAVARPRYVFVENSRSLTSAKAHSDVEPCPFCLGDGTKQPALRALGRVHGDLADLGYDDRWTCVRAADVGAPHERHRAFVWAWRRDVVIDPRVAALADPDSERREADQERDSESRPGGDGADRDDADRRSRAVADTADAGRVRVESRRVAAPISAGRPSGVSERRRRAGAHADCAASDARSSRLAIGTVEPDRHELAPAQRDRRDDARPAGNARRPGGSWQRAALRLSIGRAVASWRHEGDAPQSFVWVVAKPSGELVDFTAAIRAWEAITARPAPLPAIANRRGHYRLNPRFSEWMMGLPDGWVTAVPGLSRTAQLRIIGNGLVPLQGTLALLTLLDQYPDSEMRGMSHPESVRVVTEPVEVPSDG